MVLKQTDSASAAHPDHVQTIFSQIKTPAKTPLFMLRRGTDTNHVTSMALLSSNDLRPITYQEVFVLPLKVIKELAPCFYLAGKGIEKDGVFTYDINGDLVDLPWYQTPVDMRVKVWPGNEPLSLLILDDDSSVFNKHRFVIDGTLSSSRNKAAVVGVKIGHTFVAQLKGQHR
jgi:hypothetical protein